MGGIAGSYFCYDNPAALEDRFTGADGMGLSDEKYALLYTVYSWPNVIFPLVGGLLIDGVLGIRLSAVIFSAFIMLGQIVFALGALYNCFWVRPATSSTFQGIHKRSYLHSD